MTILPHRAGAIAAGVGLFIAAVVLTGCCCTSPQPSGIDPAAFAAAPSHTNPPPEPVAAAPDSVTLVEMKHTRFRIDPVLGLDIRQLKGRMEPMPDFEVIDFGDSESFVIDIATAEVGLTPDNMLHLFNQYVFNYDGAPLSLHAMSIDNGHLIQRGTLHKVVQIPFEMTAELTATSDGRIRLHPVGLQICGIPGQGLMDALGIQLEDLMDLSEAPGMEVDGNDMLADPREFLPPPAIRGRIVDVRVDDAYVVQIFESGETIDLPPPSDPQAENYMFFYGGTLAFGKLFMVRSDLQIVDEDPSDPFDFFLQQYLEQLVAGYSRTTDDGGLMAVFPDYDDLPTSEEKGAASR